MLRCFFILALVFLASRADSAPLAPKPGTYLRAHESGALTIQRTEEGKLTFELLSIGGNGHICSFSGFIQGSTGTVDDEPESSCQISLVQDGTTLAVYPLNKESEDACRERCGMRASFEGNYRIPSALCSKAGQQARRGEFSGHYNAHRYAQAEKLLDDLLARCSDFMHEVEIDRIRNDIALSQFHQGRHSQCLATLSATRAGQVKNQDELGLPPLDFDIYIATAKSTWFNQALCNKALKAKR